MHHLEPEQKIDKRDAMDDMPQSSTIAVVSLDPQAQHTSKARFPRWLYVAIGVLLLVGIVAGVIFQPRASSAPAKKAAAQPIQPNGIATLGPPSFDTQPNASITVVGGVVYTGIAEGFVAASNADTGRLIWRTKLGGMADMQPLVANGMVYAVANTGDSGNGGKSGLFALRASDGKLLWSYSFPYSYISNPVLAEGGIYVVSQTDVVALRASDGKLLWHRDDGGVKEDYASPVVRDGVLYTSQIENNNKGVVNAFRASDGKLLWSYKTNAGNVNTPLIEQGTVYVPMGGYPGVAGSVSALRVSDGTLLWQQKFDESFSSQLTVRNGTLYLVESKVILPGSPTPTTQTSGFLVPAFASLLNAFHPTLPAQPHKEVYSSVYALNSSDGTFLWHYTLNSGGEGWTSWLLVQDDMVYTSANNSQGKGSIYALRASDGSVVWNKQFEQAATQSILAQGILYVVSDHQSIYAFQGSDGKQLWSHPFDESTYNPLALVGSTLYVGGSAEIIYALDSGSGKERWQHSAATGK